MARPGGRNARVRAAALDATLAELVEHGFAGLGIDAVAQRSGVGRATLYRRWGGHDGLVLDAVESLAAGHAEGHPARRGPRYRLLVLAEPLTVEAAELAAVATVAAVKAGVFALPRR